MKQDISAEDLKSQIINNDIVIKRLVQDIYGCCDQEILNNLNSEGREKLSQLKEQIEKLAIIADDTKDNLLLSEANNFREQYYSTFGAFKKSNVEAMLAIEKVNKRDLFAENDQDQPTVSLRRRKKDRTALVKASSGITSQLISISRQLAEINEQSGDTLGSLTDAGENVTASAAELQATKEVIRTSGSLLNKYSRRQLTDKLLILLGVVFFAACCLYIIRKRLFN